MNSGRLQRAKLKQIRMGSQAKKHQFQRIYIEELDDHTAEIDYS